MRRISAKLNIWTVSSGLQSGLGHLIQQKMSYQHLDCILYNLQWRSLIPDGLLQGLNVLLLVVDLLHGLAQVGLELVVSVVGLRDPLLERHVRVVPVAPHLVRGLQHQLKCQSGSSLVKSCHLCDQVVHLRDHPGCGGPVDD